MYPKLQIFSFSEVGKLCEILINVLFHIVILKSF